MTASDIPGKAAPPVSEQEVTLRNQFQELIYGTLHFRREGTPRADLESGDKFLNIAQQISFLSPEAGAKHCLDAVRILKPGSQNYELLWSLFNGNVAAVDAPTAIRLLGEAVTLQERRETGQARDTNNGELKNFFERGIGIIERSIESMLSQLPPGTMDIIRAKLSGSSSDFHETIGKQKTEALTAAPENEASAEGVPPPLQDRFLPAASPSAKRVDRENNDTPKATQSSPNPVPPGQDSLNWGVLYGRLHARALENPSDAAHQMVTLLTHPALKNSSEQRNLWNVTMGYINKLLDPASENARAHIMAAHKELERLVEFLDEKDPRRRELQEMKSFISTTYKEKFGIDLDNNYLGKDKVPFKNMESIPNPRETGAPSLQIHIPAA